MIDWWSPLSALATGAAVIVALYLAWGQNESRSAELMARANLVATGLAPRLEHLTSSLRNFTAGLAFTDVHTGKHGTLEAESHVLLNISRLTLSIEEVAALIPLGDGCAYRLTHAMSLLELARKQIKDHVDSRGNLNELDDETAGEWYGLIDEPYMLLEMVRRQCSAVADKFSVPPEESEFYGD